MAERESICLRCFHSYVCEQFNEHRDVKNDKCHFYNDHFVPYADVAPVVHGQWVDNGIPDSILSGCSVCGFTCGSSSFFYCPNCGAKMDGGDGNNAICSKTT